MPYRTFTDKTGSEWQVWDVVPHHTERREGGGQQERRVRSIPIDFADRRQETRRNSTPSRRAVLRGSYSQGWLCFDNGTQKRRLTPIPKDWTTCDDDVIEDYLRVAERASGSYSAVSEDRLPLAETG